MGIVRFVLKFLLLLVFICSYLVVSPQPLNAGELSWSRVAIPSNGVGGKWVLAQGSDLDHLTLASDGTLYCFANPAATQFRLFRSTDSGKSWSYCGRVEESIVDIAISPDNPSIVCYASTSQVFKSADAGNTFRTLPPNPGGSGSANVEITSLDVAFADNSTYVTVGTRDNEPGQFGGVYWLNDNQTSVWQECELESADVFQVTFSPNFALDYQLNVVATDERDTVISSGVIGDNWGLHAGEARLPGLTPVSAGLAFPSDYRASVVSDNYTQFVWLNRGDGQGGVYCLRGKQFPASSTLTKLKTGDMSGLSVKGNWAEAKMMAGSADSPITFFSDNGGSTWSSCLKSPSGDAVSEVMLAPDFISSEMAFAVTIGAESAFSISLDKGTTWDQKSLIDSRISTILDMAVSPNFEQDGEQFLLTADIQNSLWHSTDGGIGWQRIFSTSSALSERVNLILLSPGYSLNNTILMAGTSAGKPVFWRSQDNGQHFTRFDSTDPGSGNPVNIDCWAFSPDDVLFVGSLDETNGLIYQTAPGSLSYIDKGMAGQQAINALALSPDYAYDHCVLAGNTNGSLFFSNDNGLVFEPLPFEPTETPFSGNVTPAFDAGFAQNKTIYASDDAAGHGIFRFVIGESSSWQSIDNELSLQAIIGPLLVSPNGILYGLNSQAVDGALKKGGIERCLNPGTASPVFATFTSGLDNGITLKKLWLQGSNLWTIDSTNNNLLSYSDGLNHPTNLVAPADGASGLEADNITLSWEPSTGSTTYQWQIDTDTNFQDLAGDQGTTDATQITLTSVHTDTIYYWRVRVSQPLFGPWSTVRSFDSYYVHAPTLSQPVSSGTTPIEPIFKWSVSAGADQYQLRVALDDDFANPVIDKACNSTVWQSDTALQYSTSYYWEVRAKRGAAVSDWSAVSIFTTEAESEATPVLKAPKLSSPVSSTSAAIEPIFDWSAVEGATQYNLVLSISDAFSPISINQICNANTWKCSITLAYNTSYYWKVRAINGEIMSDWSEVSAFTTRNPPASSGGGFLPPPPSPTRTPTPTPSPKLSPTPKPSPSTTASPTPTATPTTTIPSPTDFSPTPTLVSTPELVAQVKTTIVVITPSPAPIITPTSTGGDPPAPQNSRDSFLYYFVGGLAVLITVVTTLLIFVLRKTKFN